ncbi:hypothetical protein [Nocardia bovistercoris]|uniref:Translation initiation factor 2 n=1 Tax=Nocardia bovistercoris TaxID=2785916 RepID=A0A931I8A7_9NOCA|nr:hypothetical protein [Nocardia bovistercoris]MBH0775592.1 hypothetical protein [Nocardia bovistercoris]
MTHNVTAATRLFDTLPLLACDPRIRIVFTRTGSSAFDSGTAEFLARHGVESIPWAEAVRREFDLAISASYGGDLHELRSPLIVVPHGMGYNKILGNSAFGLSAEWLMHDGAVIPSAIVLSHAEQRERLRSACPPAEPKAVVAGDICFDRLRASHGLRPSYRRAFGLSGGRKLVVISSTWGPHALLDTAPDLPLRLAEQLPVDEFALLLAPHPNIVAGHSSWQFGELLAAAKRAGVTVPDDVDAWRAAIVAADLVVGDHGSVSFYSTALGNPLILASAPTHTVDPNSPVAQLLATAPVLDPHGDLHRQVRDAIATHDPNHYSAITALTTSEPDASPAILRTLMYRTLELTEPTEPAELSALPLPTVTLTVPESYLAVVRVDAEGVAHLTRFPAERLRAPDSTPRGAHLVIGVTEPRRRWLQLADVVVGVSGPGPRRWITDTLAGLPGLLLAATPTESGRWWFGDRSGTMLSASGDARACRSFASIACHHLSRGKRLAELGGEWRIDCAGRTYSLVVAPSTV